MKKIFSGIGFVLSLMVTLVACGDLGDFESFNGLVDFEEEEIDGFIAGDVAQLNPPRDLSLAEKKLQWSAIKGAEKYEVALYDSAGKLLFEQDTADSELQIEDAIASQVATIKVSSIGNGASIVNSVEAFSFLIGTSIPSNLETSDEVPEPLYPVPSKGQLASHKMEQYAFIHFGPNTYQNMEWGFGKPGEGAAFKPTKSPAEYTEQWVLEMQKIGMTGIIFTAKHHDGFCLYQTKTTLHSLRNPNYSGGGTDDVVRELAKNCKKHNMKLGLYLSPGDRNNWAYVEEEYQIIFKEQVAELLEIAKEELGEEKLFEIWFDGANQISGWFGGGEMSTHAGAPPLPLDADGNWIAGKNYDYYPADVNPKKLSDRGSEKANNDYLGEMKKMAMEQIFDYNEDVLVFGNNIRWIGNEEGWAGRTHWSFGWGEYGNEEAGSWLPGEVDVKTQAGWFHNTLNPWPKSYKKLIEFWYRSVGRNANLLLNFSPTRSGLLSNSVLYAAERYWDTIQEDFEKNLLTDKALLKSIECSNIRGNSSDFSPANLVDEDYETYWATDDVIVEDAQIVFNFTEDVSFNRVLMQEYIPLGQRVKKFIVEYSISENLNDWLPVQMANMPTYIHGDTNDPDEQTTIGYKRVLRTRDTTAKRVRISFVENRPNYKEEGAKYRPFVISEIGLYDAK